MLGSSNYCKEYRHESGCNRFKKFDNLGKYLPVNVTEIVSGGAREIDACSREHASRHGLKLTEFLPEYDKYGRNAPLKRNFLIIDYADLVLAFWDGQSRGTKYLPEIKQKDSCNP